MQMLMEVVAVSFGASEKMAESLDHFTKENEDELVVRLERLKYPVTLFLGYSYDVSSDGKENIIAQASAISILTQRGALVLLGLSLDWIRYHGDKSRNLMVGVGPDPRHCTLLLRPGKELDDVVYFEDFETRIVGAG